jgi:anaerobic magnesium-protoporphyrin IX monomethyl ester cyclase
MKVLLVNPPVDHGVPDSYRGESLGIGYIAAVLRRDGHDVEVFDAYLRCIDVRTAIKEVLSRRFDCIGLTAPHAAKDCLISIARAVRRANADVPIIAGGYLASLNPVQLLQACPEINLIVRGEGEAVAPDVFGRIDRGQDWRDAPGIAFLQGDEVILNPVPPVIEDLDSIPFPARDALHQAAVRPPARIIASRGCYHNCSFCSVKGFYALSGRHGPRFRNAERIADEIEAVMAETGATEFTFSDDDLIGPGRKMRERVTRMVDEIKKRNLHITFSAEFRADEVDQEMIDLLKEAGLNELFIGIESGSQSQLDRFNKQATVEQNKRAIQIARASGLDLRCGFIMFDPYTTVDEVQENMQFLRDTGLEADAKSDFFPLLTRLGVFRGTSLEKQLRDEELLIDRGLDLDYKVRDPQLRMMMRVSRASGAISGLVKGARRLFNR